MTPCTPTSSNSANRFGPSDGLKSGQVSTAAVDQSIQRLSQIMQKTVPLFEVETRERDKRKGKVITLSVTSVACVAGTIALCIVNPPAGSFLAATLAGELLVVEGLAIATGLVTIGNFIGLGVSISDLKESVERKFEKLTPCANIVLRSACPRVSPSLFNSLLMKTLLECSAQEYLQDRL